MLDFILAVAHHVLIFGVFATLVAELVLLRGLVNPAAVLRVAAIDLRYGIFASLILIVGFSRALFAAKGWPYYSHNAFFWAKLATFAVIGLLSIAPTLALIRWRRAARVPDAADIRRLRLYLHVELSLFVPLLIFAAAMARGYGQWG
jgi:putative membrane protein